MKKTAVILLSVALLAGVSCSSGGKYPLPEEEKPKPEQPEDNPPEDPDDEPGDEPEDPPVDVTLMEAFEESFDSNSPLENLVMDKTSDGYDFRYFPGFPSLTENGTKILMMRLSLTDSAGKGPSVTTKDYVHYGSYAVRMRLPDVTSVQAKLGARVEFGPKGLALGINLSSPTVGGYNAASKFYIYGIDWSADKLSYWVKTSATADKKVIEEITENVPDKPQKLALKYYHNDGQAPNYPYELEIDWIQYNPS